MNCWRWLKQRTENLQASDGRRVFTMDRLHHRSAWVLTAALCSACAGTAVAPPIDRSATPTVMGDDGLATTRQARKAIDEVARQAPHPAGFEELLTVTGSLSDTPLYTDSRADLLIDGPATYAAMHEAISQATRYVYLETYIFADDEVGQKFAVALMEKVAAGVAVRIIYDSIGSFGSSEDFFERMTEAGVKLIEYHSLNPIDGGNPLDANHRDHRKLLVVDGVVAFTGGVNFSNTYASSAPSQPTQVDLKEGWRDTHVAIYGPAVAGFQKTFQHQWRAQGGELADVPDDRTEPQAAGDALVAILSSAGGDGVESSIYRGYLEAMQVARERIWITQAYFAPDEEFLEQLQQAARRGVDVRVLVPGFSDSNLVLHASRSRYGQLLKSGVKIYENTTSMLHAKTAVIDGVWSTVGSSNLDYRSFLHNDEVNAVIFSAPFGEQMEAQFLKDIKHASEVSLQDWKKRPVTDRIREFFSWTVEYWL